nr:MAG TPA: hypothetical protein [Caudoviricetes sp.]
MYHNKINVNPMGKPTFVINVTTSFTLYPPLYLLLYQKIVDLSMKMWYNNKRYYNLKGVSHGLLRRNQIIVHA